MVSGSRIEGGPQIVSAGVRKTIQSIKEIVGNHSDAEIYSTLKETNMDPNETAQKLLNQDPFHEVKRKREKKKEVLPNMVYNAPEPKMSSEPENNAHSDRNIRRGRFTRNSLHDAKVIREFRIVKDNRTNHHTDNKIKPPVQSQISPNETEVQKFPSKSSANMPSSNQKQLVERHSSKSLKGVADSQPRQARDVQLNDKKDMAEDRHALVTKAGQQMQTKKSNDLQLNSTSSNNSVAGIYSSSSDPVHVPSPDSRPAANIGAIKREVGAVGVRRLSTEISAKSSSTESCSVPNLHLGHNDLSRDSFRSSAAMHKSSQPTQNHVRESVVTGLSVTRPIANNQYSSRQNQSGGHQKASSHSNKEWKPKFSKRQSSSPGVVEMASQSAPPPADASKSLEVESTQLQDKLSQVNISENENVIIAPHIRVPVTDRYRVTFGSMGTEYEPSRNPGFEAVKSAEKSYADPSASVSVATTESSGDESSGNKQVELIEQSVRNSGSSSPASAVSEQQLTERKESESSSPQDLNNYADAGLVGNNHPYFNPYDSQLPQDHSPVPQLPNISAYDPQTVYDIPYFRSMVDETARVQSLQFPQEAISSHTVNNISSSVAMVQQPPQLTQMYPQVHVSHYANLMPYRQFISPVYVPPMAVPAGYSNNPAYPHPSNGNSYLMMPGGSSHLPTSGLKYGVQQFKPAPTGSPTGFGNFTGPNGYAINAPGVGSATGLDDSSRLKYKDGNLYVPNPQTETSEIWMSSRDLLPSMQSGSYYNMSGQTPPATYLHSPSSHGSFNAAGQSSHMQFPGMYHTQPTGIHSPHLLSPAMGGNVGVGVAAGGPPTQVNAYQQPQLGHMNWTGNF